MADDLGYADLGVYGSNEIQTPNLDQLADGGIILTDGYVSAPYCGPSRAGFMTGRYQQRHGFWCNPTNWPVDRSQGLDLEEETIADVLRRGGYRTCAIGKWHLGSAEAFHPINRGFDEYFGFLGGGHHYFPMQYEENMKRWARDHSDTDTPFLYNYGSPLEVSGIPIPPQEGYLTDLLTDYSIGFMKRASGTPFFLYIAYNAPHVPLEAPEETIEKYSSINDKKRRTYAAMVDNLDMNMGRIVEYLRESGEFDNTLIVFISDNGGKPQNGGFNGELRGHKGQVYEGGVRVPFIWSWPNVLPAGEIVTTPISSLDLLPTFAVAAGVNPAGKPLDGINVLPVLLGESGSASHARLFWERGGQRGIRQGEWKATLWRERSNWQLFNLTDDVGEQNDLAKSNPEQLEEMKALYEQWIGQFEGPRWSDPKY
ncbi:sulfatase-like hydrolase/transferase [Ruficoccus amylovorans]|uniref:Sulfatase-like hydrolase/transferase n=1 Tax=Ruficoccus amylovorans TaxID=1804625 RepID=A0A842HAM1_9BACT|nr:sulfatase-like hydrolase/transferase [Ruficoccus amylovorans]